MLCAPPTGPALPTTLRPCAGLVAHHRAGLRHHSLPAAVLHRIRAARALVSRHKPRLHACGGVPLCGAKRAAQPAAGCGSGRESCACCGACCTTWLWHMPWHVLLHAPAEHAAARACNAPPCSASPSLPASPCHRSPYASAGSILVYCMMVGGCTGEAKQGIPAAMDEDAPGGSCQRRRRRRSRCRC